jgi:nucleotide-binding universal stress UspA family protein
MKKLSIKNILVPIDFSEMSIRAITTAKQLARRFGSNVHLAHIQELYYPPVFSAAPLPVPMLPATYIEDVLTSEEERLKMLSTEHELNGTCQVQIGAPVFDEICRIARRISADLIVTSTHGHTGLKHVFLGSTAERVVQHSPCPVFVAKHASRRTKGSARIDNILVPVDFSRCSLEGLEHAIQFADRFAAKITVLNTVHLDYAYVGEGVPMYDLPALRRDAKTAAEREMASFVRGAKFGGVKFETAVRIGPPVDQICDLADKKSFDLIIMSTHGRTGFKHVMIGSTAENVVRRSGCSVLVVPSHPDARSKYLARRVEPEKAGQGITRRIKARKTVGTSKKPALVAPHPHPFPERRKTNKFRESHRADAGS